jgi:thiosulfate/3-mercaptopyruvate sulfurtransferase
VTIPAFAPADPPIRVVSTAWLASHLNDRDLVVVQVEMNANATSPRIPGARILPYNAMTVSRNGVSTELPEPDSLADLFAALGISESSMVVVTTSHEAPMAARALMSLDYLGHQRLAFLDGGVAKWIREGRPTATNALQVSRGTLKPSARPSIVVDAAWISSRVLSKGMALIDTRTDGEYVGAGERHGMPSEGHIDGASQLQWEQLFADANHMELKDSTSLKALYTQRSQPGDTLVTYCWIGYRASMTYVGARIAGLPARFYDGSYQDWQQRKLPVTAGAERRKR